MTKPGLWYIIYNNYKLVSISNPHIFQAKPTSSHFQDLLPHQYLILFLHTVSSLYVNHLSPGNHKFDRELIILKLRLGLFLNVNVCL